MASQRSQGAGALLPWVLLLAGAACRADVVDVSSGAFTAIAVTDCRSAAAIAVDSQTPDRCRPGAGLTPRPVETSQRTVLGSLASSTQATRPLATRGADVSGAWASGSDGSLLVQAGAFSGTPYSRVGVLASVAQGFLYTGVDGQTRTVRHDVHVLSSVPPSSNRSPNPFVSNSTAPATLLGGFMTVFSLETPTVQIDTVTGIGGGMFNAAAYSRPDYRLEGESNVYPLFTEQAGDTISFVAQTGRYYFVEVMVLLQAQFGAQADARHTVTASLGFNSAQGFLAGSEGFEAAAPWAQPLVLASSVGAVPEPATGVMWLAALGGAALWRRRGQAKSASSTTR